MKIQMRRGVFETNSSSVHSITMCDLDEYNDWIDGKLYLNRWEDGFVTKEEYDKQLTEYIKNYCDSEYHQGDIDDEDLEDLTTEFKGDYGYLSFEDWKDLDYEIERTEYTTKHGDTVIALCYYGHD